MKPKPYTEFELELYRLAGVEPPRIATKEEIAAAKAWDKAVVAAVREWRTRQAENKAALRREAKMRANLEKARVARERNAKRRKKAHQAVLKMFKLL